MNWMETGRFLIVAGAVLVILGFVFTLSDKIPLGHLPGDFIVGGKRIKIYIPIATCIMLSIVLTLVLNFFSKR